ncbi:hypothetical protein [Luteolibacter luteus]|nr:hypothetical protein [Luteolibacter luteus]
MACHFSPLNWKHAEAVPGAAEAEVLEAEVERAAEAVVTAEAA